MGAVRDLVRIAVLKTNPHWPFSKLNRVPYQAALAMFERLCRQWPQIRSAYVRHTLAEHDWIPGSSDIDLTLILTPLGADEEVTFLRSFWPAYEHLRRVFPMLGEVDILTEDELEIWLSIADRDAGQRHWNLLSGVNLVRPSAEPHARWRIRAVNHALWMYLEHYVRPSGATHDFLAAADRNRLARKVVRLVRPVLRESGQSAPPPCAADPAREWALVVTALDQASRLAGSTPGSPSNPGEGLEAVLRHNSGRGFILTGNAADPDRLAELIRSLPQWWPGTSLAPLSPATFAHVLRHYDPFMRADWDGCYETLQGHNPLESAAAEPDVTGFLRDEIANALLFPRSHGLFGGSPALTSSALRARLAKYLAIRTYLSTGRLPRSRAEMEGWRRAEYPANDKPGYTEFRAVTFDIKRRL